MLLECLALVVAPYVGGYLLDRIFTKPGHDAYIQRQLELLRGDAADVLLADLCKKTRREGKKGGR